MEHIQCVVVGAGVVGLALARALSRAGREVLILEAGEGIGGGVSSRNSEVIHAGLYYRPGSLMARFCASGRRALYGFCASHGVAHKRLGKLIVITNEAQYPALLALQQNAGANGVDDLRMLNQQEIRDLEPTLNCPAALLSPSTGILSAHDYMLALLGDAEQHGAILALSSPCTGGDVRGAHPCISVGEDQPLRIRCEQLFNCAALGAQQLALGLEGLDHASVPRLYYAKGNYFSLTGRSPFQHLIYPLPGDAWLGVHSTADLSGRCKFGPDLHWVDELDYAVDETQAANFYQAIRRWWPGLADGTLQPDYAGIRPKLYAEGQPGVDFQIQGPGDHGIRGLYNLFGIESPGLTSSLAIADFVVQLSTGH